MSYQLSITTSGINFKLIFKKTCFSNFFHQKHVFQMFFVKKHVFIFIDLNRLQLITREQKLIIIDKEFFQFFTTLYYNMKPIVSCRPYI